MGVTIKQIAELANVSRATVDKVLNDRPGVNEATKRRVLDIANGLGYKPNILGKALVGLRNSVKIGVLLTPEHNLFIQEILQGIKQASDEFSIFGIEVSTRILTTLEPVELIGILDSMEKEGFAGIAILPMDDENVKIKINSLINHGIAIITFNSRIEGINDFCFVGQDHKRGGTTAGGLMGKLLPDGNQVGVIISSHKLSCHRYRLAGFRSKLDTCFPHLRIVEVEENQDITEDAFRLTLHYCNKYPNLDGLYITGGGINGVGRALKIAKMEQRVKVICHDFVPGTKELLKEGVVDFAIGQNPTLQGYQSIKFLFEYIVKKQPPESPYYEIPIYIATYDNI